MQNFAVASTKKDLNKVSLELWKNEEQEKMYWQKMKFDQAYKKSNAIINNGKISFKQIKM